MTFYDLEPPVTPPEPRYCAHCCECGGGIFAGEPSVNWDGERLCMRCAFHRVHDNFDMDAFDAMIDRLEEHFGFSVETETEE